MVNLYRYASGTIYQMDAPYVPPSDVFIDPNDPFGIGALG